jgi:hypothetical protein
LSPLLVADVVVTLALDAESVGRIVVIRADCELYDVDPEVPIRMSSGWPGERRAGHSRRCTGGKSNTSGRGFL